MSNFLYDATQMFLVVAIIYFFLANTAYLLLLLAAVWELSRQKKLLPLTTEMQDGSSSIAPGISILAPAYNEQETVVESVRSFLMLNYPAFEVIVISDGSNDETLKRLTATYQLAPVEMIYDPHLSQTEIRGVYQSPMHPNLIVVDKVNGGKADALNVGIGFSKYDLYCAVDSDSLLEDEALLKVAAPFLENPHKLIASGGTVRIANGARVRFGRVENIELPKNMLVLMQIVEYTRAFLCGRIGWNFLNATFVISGAFGLFSKAAVKKIGGYTKGSVGEDMELIIRLHAFHLERNIPYSIVFVPDPVCWTEAPADAKSLGKQRDRWQRGLADILVRNRHMIMSPKYGAVGLLAFPYFIFVELLGPIFELLSIAILVIAACTHGIDFTVMWTFFLASALYGAVLSLGSLVIEEVYYAKYTRVSQLLILFAVCLLESIWYRQISTVWRVQGVYKYLRGDHTWGTLQRAGFKK